MIIRQIRCIWQRGSRVILKWQRLLFALSNEGIETEYLRHTESKKHVWARDYMPIQLTKTRFVQYRYGPDYLEGYPEYIPEYRKISRGLKLKMDELKLVVDGGNVVKFRNKVVMTEKVFEENSPYSDSMVRSQLEEAFGCEVCIIPWDRYEMFGHADGMVRSIGDNYALMVPDCLELVRDGGALNCVTWNVYSGISRPSSGHIPAEASPL